MMVGAVYWQPTRNYKSPVNFLSKGQQLPVAVLHSSHELGELLQGSKHYDSTIKIIIALLFLL